MINNANDFRLLMLKIEIIFFVQITTKFFNSYTWLALNFKFFFDRLEEIFQGLSFLRFSQALRMMSAIVPGSQTTSDAEQERNHISDRQKLQEELLGAAKLCHVRFGGKAELATESDQCVSRLCYAFEAVFRHGLRANRMEKFNSAIR